MKKLFIIFAVLCLAAPAMAADWNFYGSARFATFWVDNDLDQPGEDSDDQDLSWDQQGNSRIGANVKFNDQIGGTFEMSDSFGKRKLYGTYTFGNGSQLLIGQTYTPSSSYFYSNSVIGEDGDLLGIGQFYVGRREMIQWSMAGFKVALINPAVDGAYVPGRDDFDTTTLADKFETDVELPKIEVSYGFKSDMFFVDVYGGYQTYDIDNPAGASDYSVDSYVLGGGFGLTFGAFYVNVGAHIGQNLGDYGAYNPRSLESGAVENATLTDVEDSDGLGYLAVVGFNVSEMLTLEAGYGHEEAEVDVANTNTTEVDQYYVNAVINIAPGFFIVPEIGMIKNSEDATDAEPESFYAGAKWQINF